MVKSIFIVVILFITYYFSINYLMFNGFKKGQEIEISSLKYIEDDPTGKILLKVKHYFSLVNLKGTIISIKDSDSNIYYIGEYREIIRLKRFPNTYLIISIYKDNKVYIFGAKGIDFISDNFEGDNSELTLEELKNHYKSFYDLNTFENKKKIIWIRLNPFYRNFSWYSVKIEE